MANKITKRDRNLKDVDNWLDTMGLYRKIVAFDETCLFRAVSEQIFGCQTHHERVRMECIAYARRNFKEFSHLTIKGDEDWRKHLNLLEKHMVVCGNIEIHIISRIYKRKAIIFDAARQRILEVTKGDFSKSLFLCLMNDEHYDVVYKTEEIATAGFCQSIIYKILFEQVFDIPNVDDIVGEMLYPKSNAITLVETVTDKKGMVTAEANNNEMELEATQSSTRPISITTKEAPFTYRVAKALDPKIYRNVEFDTWENGRREFRMGNWYHGDDRFVPGAKCILNDAEKGETYDCYIQKMIKNQQNKCVVYITRLAERRTVNYSDLSPESDAKPWPLPSRFLKNEKVDVPQPPPPPPPPVGRVLKSTKKHKKERRRTNGSPRNVAAAAATAAAEAVANTDAYVVGLPLHNPNDSNPPQYQELPTETRTQQTSKEFVTITPYTQTGPVGYRWDQTQWHPYLPPPPPTPRPPVLPQTPTAAPHSMFEFNNLNPMVAYAPVTPDVVPRHDRKYSFGNNSHHVDPYQGTSDFLPLPIKMDLDKPIEDNRSQCHISSYQQQPISYPNYHVDSYQPNSHLSQHTSEFIPLPIKSEPDKPPIEGYNCGSYQPNNLLSQHTSEFISLPIKLEPDKPINDSYQPNSHLSQHTSKFIPLPIKLEPDKPMENSNRSQDDITYQCMVNNNDQQESTFQSSHVGPTSNPNIPLYNNYHVDSYLPNSHSSQHTSEFIPLPIKSDSAKPIEGYTHYNNYQPQSTTVQSQVGPTFPFYYNYNVDNSQWSHHSPEFHPLPINNNYNMQMQQSTVQPHDIPTPCPTLTLQNTPKEVYPSMIPIPYSAPLNYVPAPEMTGILMPTIPNMYGSPVNMQYMPSCGYYPPTQPTTWYPDGVNSQGFIFPPTRQ